MEATGHEAGPRRVHAGARETLRVVLSSTAFRLVWIESYGALRRSAIIFGAYTDGCCNQRDMGKDILG